MTNLSITQIIYEQLGGDRFALMTGAKDFVSTTDTSLHITLSKNASGCNRLSITLEPNDTYTMLFYKMTKKRGTMDYVLSKGAVAEEVFYDELQDYFTNHTKQYTKFNQEINTSKVCDAIENVEGFIVEQAYKAVMAKKNYNKKRA